MSDLKSQNRNQSVVSPEAPGGGAKSGQSVSDYMEELIDRLNHNMGLPRDSTPFRAGEASPAATHHVEPNSHAAARDPDEEAARHTRPTGERMYDLAAVRREAGGPGSGLAAAVAERLAMAHWRLAITVMALAAAFGLVRWGLTARSEVVLYGGIVVLIVGLFWLYRYFKVVSQLAKAVVKRTTVAAGGPGPLAALDLRRASE